MRCLYTCAGGTEAFGGPEAGHEQTGGAGAPGTRLFLQALPPVQGISCSKEAITAVDVGYTIVDLGPPYGEWLPAGWMGQKCIEGNLGTMQLAALKPSYGTDTKDTLKEHMDASAIWDASSSLLAHAWCGVHHMWEHARPHYYYMGGNP
jgi:hypothetical protein